MLKDTEVIGRMPNHINNVLQRRTCKTRIIIKLKATAVADLPCQEGDGDGVRVKNGGDGVPGKSDGTTIINYEYNLYLLTYYVNHPATDGQCYFLPPFIFLLLVGLILP